MMLRQQLQTRHRLENRGQVWIETVIYTLIGLALIALVLAVVTPKINQYKDKALLDQTLNSLNLMDGKISEVLNSPGNRRIVEFKLGKGTLEINGSNDRIVYIIEESKVMYSEPGISISVGKVNVTTEKLAKDYRVTFTMSYSLNITNKNLDASNNYPAASLPYQFSIENKGFANNKQVIEISA